MKKIMFLMIVLILMLSLEVKAEAILCFDNTCVENRLLTSPVDKEDFKAPILGEFDAKTVSIPLLAVVLGTVDGFNPCAMWILVFLITMLWNVPDKRKRWILGLSFILTSGLVYLFLMLTWLNLAVFLTQVKLIRLGIAIFSIVFGMISVNKYLEARKQEEIGCNVTNNKQKSKIAGKLKKIIEQKSFLLSLIGIIILAASINILEALCSLGLPIMFTQVLAVNELGAIKSSLYIGLYILFFMIDDLIIFAIAMKTMNIKGISNKYTKYSHLVGGIIMVLLGIIMALKPEWLMFNF